jgi:hypothetical protein
MHSAARRLGNGDMCGIRFMNLRQRARTSAPKRRDIQKMNYERTAMGQYDSCGNHLQASSFEHIRPSPIDAAGIAHRSVLASARDETGKSGAMPALPPQL